MRAPPSGSSGTLPWPRLAAALPSSRDRRQRAGAGERRSEDRRGAALLDHAEGGPGDVRRRCGLRLGGIGAQLEQDRQDDRAGGLDLPGERGIALGALEDAAEQPVRALGLIRVRGRALAQRLPQGLERGHRNHARLRLGEQQIERDRARAGALQTSEQLGDRAAAPRPAPDLAEAAIVDPHQHDRVRGRRRTGAGGSAGRGAGPRAGARPRAGSPADRRRRSASVASSATRGADSLASRRSLVIREPRSGR